MTLPKKKDASRKLAGATRTERPLWTCPRCERQFANPNQSHACGPPVELAEHFRGRDPAVYRMFEEILALVRKCGPVKVLSEKTRIAFQVRMSFMALSARQTHLRGHFVFARRVPNPRFQKIETFSPRNVVHHFCVENSAELDAEFAGWVCEAYAVGRQEHLIADTGRGEGRNANAEGRGKKV